MSVEQIEDIKKVIFTCKKLKSHESLWWNTLQFDRQIKGNENVIRWDKMALIGKLLHVDYSLNLLRRSH